MTRLCALAAALLAYAPLAHAYIDPNLGLLLTQGIIAVIGAVLFMIRHPREALRNLCRRIFKRKGTKTEREHEGSGR